MLVEPIMNKTWVTDEQDSVIAARREEIRRFFDQFYKEHGLDRVSPDDVEINVRPGETRAQAALREIRESFAESGITEEELQESGRQIREELHTKYYGGE